MGSPVTKLESPITREMGSLRAGLTKGRGTKEKLRLLRLRMGKARRLMERKEVKSAHSQRHPPPTTITAK